MDVSTDRFVHRMPSMVDWASSGQRAAAACSAPLPLIDGQDVDNLALGIAIFGFGAWEDIAKLSGSNSALEDEAVAKRLLDIRPELKEALSLSPESSQLVSNTIRAAASSLQLNDELMRDEISLDVDDASLLKALLASYGREATVKALKAKALLEVLLRSDPVAASSDEGDAAAFVFPAGKLPALASLPSLQHLMQGISNNPPLEPAVAIATLPPSSDVYQAPSTSEAGPPLHRPPFSPLRPPAPTTSLTPPRSFGKPGGSFAGRKPPRPVSASPQHSTGAGAGLSQQPEPGAKACGNCGTTHTSLWRKVGDVVMCNACGIYYKNHGYHRPMDLAAKTTLSQTSGSIFGDLGGAGGGLANSGGGGGRAGSSQANNKKRRTAPLSVEGPLLAPLLVKSQGLGGGSYLMGHGEDTATSPLARGGSKAKRGFHPPPKTSPPFASDPLDGASGEMEEDHAKIDEEEDDGTDDAALGGARKSGRRRMAKKGFGDEWFEPSDLVLRREGQPVLKRLRQQSSAGGGYASEGYQSDYMDSQGPGGGGGGQAKRTDSKGGGPSNKHLSRPLASTGGAPPSPLRAVSASNAAGAGASAGGGGEGEGGLDPEGNGLAPFDAAQSPLPSDLQGHEDEGEGEGDDASSGSSDATDLRVDADSSLVALALMQLKEAKGRWGLLPKVLQAGGGKRSGNNTPAASFNPTLDPSLSPLRPSPAPSNHGGGGAHVAAPAPSATATAARKTTSSAGRARSKSPYSGSHFHRKPSPEVTRTTSGGGGGGGGGGVAGVQCCSNCGTTKTPMWRKDKVTGALNCNACGIYRQTHGYDRPLSGGGGAGSSRNSVDGSRGGGGGGVTPPGSPLLVHGAGGGGEGAGLSWLAAPLQPPSLLGGLVSGRPPLPLPPLAARPPLPPSSLSKESYPQTASVVQSAPPSNETMRAFEQLLSSMPGFPPHLLPPSSTSISSAATPPPLPASLPSSSTASYLSFPFSLGMDLNALNSQIQAQHARQLQELQMHQQQLALLQQLKQQATAMQLSQQQEQERAKVASVQVQGSSEHEGGDQPGKPLSIEIPASLSAIGSDLRSSRGGFASPIPLSSPMAGFLSSAAVAAKNPQPARHPTSSVVAEGEAAGQGGIHSLPRPNSPAIDLLLQQALQQQQQQALTQPASEPGGH